MINKLIILVLIILQSSGKLLIPSNVKVTITNLTTCDSSEKYPVELYNVAVNIDKGKITVTGTLTTLANLSSPIKAILEVEKKEYGVWIEVPCVGSIGSCTYNDLCIYSVPSNKTCPESFISNNVPCRCPIPKGNYTIPPSLQFDIYPNNYLSIYTGKYWAKVTVLDKESNLTCYEVYFTIDNSIDEENNEINFDHNEYMDRIFVTLV